MSQGSSIPSSIEWAKAKSGNLEIQWFPKEKFTNRGPLVLTKELCGDVKFADCPSASLIKVQFDDSLNEVNDIGSCVEVVPEGTKLSNVQTKAKGRTGSHESKSKDETKRRTESPIQDAPLLPQCKTQSDEERSKA
ncbi:hypothetical protein GCK32_015292 [Trichostrongylus colubriformis]|uniref:Uncharacterized protein n=1 Tax=Trichostrongylus colubriformis TaxID=6319 RepID=A0AAN8F100_TRICO